MPKLVGKTAVQPASDTPAARVAQLNAGTIQPGAGDPAFALRMQDALARERAQEEELIRQNALARAEFMNSLPNGANAPTNKFTAPLPGTSVHNWLLTLSMNSPRGRAQQQANVANDMALRQEIKRLQETPMPSEFALPGSGLKGHAQNYLNWIIGRPDAL